MASDHSMGSSPTDRRKANNPLRAASFRPCITNTLRGSAPLVSVVVKFGPLSYRFGALTLVGTTDRCSGILSRTLRSWSLPEAGRSNPPGFRHCTVRRVTARTKQIGQPLCASRCRRKRVAHRFPAWVKRTSGMGDQHVAETLRHFAAKRRGCGRAGRLWGESVPRARTAGGLSDHVPGLAGPTC